MWPFRRKTEEAAGEGLDKPLLGNEDSQVTLSPGPSPSPQPPPVTANGVLTRSSWPDTALEVPQYLNNLPEYLSPEITPELSRSRTLDAHIMNYSSLSRFLWYMRHYGPENSWFLAGLLTSTADRTVGVGDFPVIGWAYLWAQHLYTDNVTKQILCKKMSKDVFVAIINIVKSAKDVDGPLNDKYTGKLIFIDYTGLDNIDENPKVRVVDRSSKSIVETDLITLDRTIGKKSRLYVIDANSVKNNQKVLYVNGGKTISEIDGIVKDIYANLPSSASTSAAGPASPSPSPSSARGGKRLKKTTSKNRKYRTMRKIKSRKHRHYRSKKRC
jgi:hypothetical protein